MENFNVVARWQERPLANPEQQEQLAAKGTDRRQANSEIKRSSPDERKSCRCEARRHRRRLPARRRTQERTVRAAARDNENRWRNQPDIAQQPGVIRPRSRKLRPRQRASKTRPATATASASWSIAAKRRTSPNTRSSCRWRGVSIRTPLRRGRRLAPAGCRSTARDQDRMPRRK